MSRPIPTGSAQVPGKWLSVNRSNPCPACGKTDWCAWTPDGKALRCMRDGDAPVGMRRAKTDTGGGTLYVTDDDGRKDNCQPIRRPSVARPNATSDWSATVDRLRAKLTDERLAALADATGVPAPAWAKLSPGWADNEDLRTMKAGGAGWPDDWPTGAWVFPEHGGDGRVIGASLRAIDGRKGAPGGMTGARRGLIVPNDLHEHLDPVLVVEGASDVAACMALSVAAVGRPSNRAGADDLADLLDGREVLVVGERDAKPGGAWPGRDGAKTTAKRIAAKWGEPVKWALPPMDAKDMRAWLAARLASGLASDNVEAMADAGRELLAALTASAKEAKPERRSTADAVVTLALEHYRLGRSIDGEAFAVERDGPGLALLFRGGASALRAALAKQYRATTGKTPNAAALADALTALEGMAQDTKPEPVALRLAELPSNAGEPADVVLDLGDPSGLVVVVTPDGWTVANRSPVLFRRTALTGALPEPENGANADDLAALRDLLNVGEDTWPLVVGWLVAACIPSMPHPVLMLGGEQGTGKSTAARLMVGLIDPSPALLRSEPRDSEGWAMTAAGSWAVCIDNVSRIPGWWSDALCKAVTGDGWVRRKLYTDSDLAVLTFRRCIVLTSIDAGALRGDLGDRLLLIDLERIDDANRRTEADLDLEYQIVRPRLLGSLLSAVARTLAALPGVKLDTMPRMADFARVLAALDSACPELTGGRALDLFIAQRTRIAQDVVDGDPVAAAVVQFIDNHGEWTGTASKLLDLLIPEGDSRTLKGWPKTASGMGSALRRNVSPLRSLGIDVDHDRDADRNQTRRWTIRKIAQSAVRTVQPSGQDGDASDSADSSDASAPNKSGRVRVRI